MSLSIYFDVSWEIICIDIEISFAVHSNEFDA